MSITIILHASSQSADGLAGKGGDSERITFDAPRIVIGRSESCDLRLPETSVSARHLSIRQRGTEYVVIDEGSSNGTRIGRMRLTAQTPHAISDATQIRLGRVTLEVVVGQQAATQKPMNAARSMALGMVVRNLAAEGEDVRPRIETASGQSVVLDRGQRVVVGRSREADFVIADDGCSRRHAEIEWRGDAVVVRDLGSKTGTSIAGRALRPGGDSPWQPGESLELGGISLSLVFSAFKELEAIERAPDERVAAADLELGPEPVEADLPDEDEVAVSDEDQDSEQVELAAARLALETARPREPRVGWTLTDFAVVMLAFGVFSLSAVGYFVLLR